MSAERNPKFTHRELEIFVDEVTRVEPQLFGSLVRSTSVAEKTRMWQRIADRVNAVAPIRRTIDECKTRWYDLRRKVKRKMREEHAQSQMTGGGPPRRPVHYHPWEEKVQALMPSVGVHGLAGVPETGERGESTPNDGGEDSQAQSRNDPDPTNSDASHHSTDDHDRPGPSGVPTRVAPGAGTSAPNANTPATSQETAGSPAHSEHQSQSDNEGQWSPGSLDGADNTNTARPQGSPQPHVPSTTGQARVGRGGGSVGRQRRQPAQDETESGMSQLRHIMHAYRRDTREIGQLVGILSDMKDMQAEQHASQQEHQGRMEARLAELLTVRRDIRDISHSLRRIADNMQHPPCVTSQATSRRRSAPDTAREEEEDSSDGGSHASSGPARGVPPRKVGRPPKKR